MKITKSIALKQAKKIKLDLDVIPLDIWTAALNIELEHGKKLGSFTNVTNDNINLTTKIAVAHLLESPNYYQKLIKLEQSLEKYWEKRKKPSIFKQ